MQTKGRGAAVLGGGVFAVSLAGSLVRLASAPAPTVSAWRMIFTTVIFLAARLGRPTQAKRPAFKYCFWGSIFLAAHFAAWIASVGLTTVASSQLLVTTEPLFAGFMGSILLREKPSLRFWLGTLISFIGAAWIGHGDLGLGGTHLVGDGLAILGAAFAAGYLLCGRAARRHSDLEDYLRWVYGGASVWLIAYAICSDGGLLGISFGGLCWTALMALSCQVIGHSLLNLAVRAYPAHLVTMALLGEGLLGACWAALILGDYPSPQWFQGAPVMLAGLLVALTSHRAYDPHAT